MGAENVRSLVIFYTWMARNRAAERKSYPSTVKKIVQRLSLILPIIWFLYPHHLVPDTFIMLFPNLDHVVSIPPSCDCKSPHHVVPISLSCTSHIPIMSFQYPYDIVPILRSCGSQANTMWFLYSHGVVPMSP